MRFSVGDRTLFAEYRLLGREQVAVIFAFEPARTAAAAAALEKMGAQVLGRRDAIGYLYARGPIDRVESRRRPLRFRPLSAPRRKSCSTY